MEVLENMEIGRKVNYFLILAIIALIFSLIFSIIILSCVPPISRDALTQHLAVPKLYIKHGSIYEIPFMQVSYYPMNMDLLYLLPLYLGNDIAPKFIHFSFALLTALLIFRYLKRRINVTYALVGVISFLSIPIIVKLSITVYVDLGFIFFTTASLLFLLKWVESGFRGRFLILSALFCGLAMGTKYNGLITFFLLTLFVSFIYARYNQSKRQRFLRVVGFGIIFASIALLVFSPWMIRNFAWTGNPIYPLYDQWFNPQSAILQNAPGIFEIRTQIHHESWWKIALLPARIFFQGQDGNPKYFDGELNFFLFLFPFLAFYKVQNDSNTIRVEKMILLAFATLYFAFSFFSTVLRIRYISPILPPLVFLSAYGLRNLFDLVKDADSALWRWTGIMLSFGVVAFSLWGNAAYVYEQYKKIDPFVFLSGKVSRDEYIDRYRYEYPAMRYINKNLPADARVLLVYSGGRVYYCDRDFIFDMKSNRSALHQLVKNSNSPEQVLTGLKGMGITHLFIRYDIFEPWVKTEFSHKEKQLLNAFFENHMDLLFFKWGYGVFHLMNL